MRAFSSRGRLRRLARLPVCVGREADGGACPTVCACHPAAAGRCSCVRAHTDDQSRHLAASRRCRHTHLGLACTMTGERSSRRARPVRGVGARLCLTGSGERCEAATAGLRRGEPPATRKLSTILSVHATDKDWSPVTHTIVIPEFLIGFVLARVLDCHDQTNCTKPESKQAPNSLIQPQKLKHSQAGRPGSSKHDEAGGAAGAGARGRRGGRRGGCHLL